MDQAAIRELQEETGLQGEIRDVVGINECFLKWQCICNICNIASITDSLRTYIFGSCLF